MANFDPHMPGVDVVDNGDEIFAQARALAAKADAKGRSPVAITPSHRMFFSLGSVPPNTMSAENVLPIEQMVPQNPPQVITVIALNTVETLVDNGWKKSIPFAGFLLGFAYIGHTVVITEGHESILPAACRGADLLIVDGGMVPFLQKNWLHVAGTNLRTKQILILNRDGSAQRLASTGSANPGQNAPPSQRRSHRARQFREHRPYTPRHRIGRLAPSCRATARCRHAD